MRCASRALLLAWMVCAGQAGMALEMRTGEVEGVGTILLLQDCEPTDQKKCAEHETQVHDGDAQRIEAVLRKRTFAEVWLNSGGGDSEEGQRIGRVFRRNGVAVRIRSGHSCASACTVAFLGGVIRTVDEGAHYLVHARSAVMSAVPAPLLGRILAEPAGELEREYLRQRKSARLFVADRLSYLQTMIGGQPDMGRYAQVMQQGLDQRPAYIESPRFTADVARIRVEGAPAVHTIVMANERASFDEALALARPRVAELGHRAAAAHRMMEAMFSTAIVRTADLSQETLVKLGFVTPQLNRP